MLAESHFVPVDITHRLHVRRICGSSSGPVAFLLHGTIENGRIFYADKREGSNSPDGKGLAWYLARAGYDVFVPDLRGRGLSVPATARGFIGGQTETLMNDLPAVLEFIQTLRPNAPQIWISHSWGGVLLSALLARHPEYLPRIQLMAHFGSKRMVNARTREKLIKIEAFWFRIAFVLTRLYGYLPMKDLGIGGDNESSDTHRECVEWMQARRWVDRQDGFDYATTLQNLPLPPTLHLAGRNDFSLGHPDDVRYFSTEVGAADTEFWLLAKANGFAHDYDHINMMTHPDAASDIFPRLLNWLQTKSIEQAKLFN